MQRLIKKAERYGKDIKSQQEKLCHSVNHKIL